MEKRDALAAALARNEGRLYAYFRRMGADREAARDLSQETFYRAIKGSSGFRGDAPFDVWLLGIARNVWRAWASRHPETIGVPAAEPAPEAHGIDVRRALLRLDPADREVLTLRFALDLSGDDTAKVLGISHDAVRQRVARAKDAFKRVWESP